MVLLGRRARLRAGPALIASAAMVTLLPMTQRAYVVRTNATTRRRSTLGHPVGRAEGSILFWTLLATAWPHWCCICGFGWALGADAWVVSALPWGGLLPRS